MLKVLTLYVCGIVVEITRSLNHQNKPIQIGKVLSVLALVQSVNAYAQKTCNLLVFPDCEPYITNYTCPTATSKVVNSTVNHYGGTPIEYANFISISTQDVTFLEVTCNYMGNQVTGTGCASSNNLCEEIIPKGTTSSGSSIPVKPVSSIIKPNLQCGSVIQSDNRVVGETVSLSGIKYSMDYFTSWVPGNAESYKINIPLAVGGPRIGISSFDVSVQSNGVVYHSAHLENNQSSLNYSYQWNGRDSLGNLVLGSMPFVVTVVEHGTSGDNSVVTNVNLGGFKSKAVGLGGWIPEIYAFYDTNSKMLHKGDGSFRRVNAKQNSLGQLYVAEQDASLVYVFDQQGRHLFTKTGLLGANLYAFNYDSAGRLSSIVEPFSKATVFNRSLLGVWTSITAPNGQVTSVTLDANEYVAQFSDPLNQNHKMTYSGPNGLIATFQKPNGQISSFDFDADGNLLKDAHASGYFIQLVKNLNPDFNADISVSTAMGRTTRVQSNSDGASVSRTLTLPNGIQQQYSYSVSGATAASTSSGSGINYSTSYQNDARFSDMADFPTSTSLQFQGGSRIVNQSQNITLSDSTNPFSISSLIVTSELAGSNSKVTVNFDPLAKVFSSTTRMGRISKVGIDSLERVVSQHTGNLLPVKFSYTKENLTSIKQGSRQSNLSYDSKGRIKSFENPLRQVTSFFYDIAGRMLSQKLPDGRTVGYSYDSNGNVTSITPPNGKIHSFGFNNEDQVEAYNPPTLSGVALTSSSYSYNADKQLTKILRPDGESLLFNYNSTSGFLTSIVTSSGSHSFTMDANSGQVSSIRTVDGIGTAISYSGPYISQVAEYDSNNNMFGAYSLSLLHGALVASDVVSSGISSSPVSYSYDDDELLSAAGDLAIVRDVPNGFIKSTVLGKVSDSYSYNSFGELKKYEATYNGKTIYKLDIDRDSAGRIEIKNEMVVRKGDPIRSSGNFKNWFFKNIEGNGNISRYFYDSAGRLIASADGWFQSSFYQYDLNSNRIGGLVDGKKIKATYDAQDRLLTYNSLAFTYNANGELTSKTNTVLNQKTQYFYDVFSNLKKVILPNGKLIEYEIDGLNRRVGKKVNGQVQKRWIYMDATRIAAELDANGNIVKRFVYGSKSFIPDYMIMNGSKYKIVSDNLGSPRLVVNSLDGSLLAVMNHDEFGKVLENVNPEVLPMGFAGGLYDLDTQLVRFGVRDYDAETGRWTSKDPILFKGGDTNLFGYVANDPVNGIDPSGLAKCVYSQSAHTLICVSNDGQNIAKLGADGVFSGNDIPITSFLPFYGPIPTGQYDMTQHEAPGYWRLNAKKGAVSYAYRKAFLLHPGTVSNGCITADKSNPKTKAQYNLLNNLLINDLATGGSVLEVIP